MVIIGPKDQHENKKVFDWQQGMKESVKGG